MGRLTALLNSNIGYLLMTVDWNAVATIAAPIIALFLGVWVKGERGPTPFSLLPMPIQFMRYFLS